METRDRERLGWVFDLELDLMVSALAQRLFLSFPLTVKNYTSHPHSKFLCSRAATKRCQEETERKLEIWVGFSENVGTTASFLFHTKQVSCRLEQGPGGPHQASMASKRILASFQWFPTSNKSYSMTNRWRFCHHKLDGGEEGDKWPGWGKDKQRKQPRGGQKLKMSQEKRIIRPVTWLETGPFKILTGSEYWGGVSGWNEGVNYWWLGLSIQVFTSTQFFLRGRKEGFRVK